MRRNRYRILCTLLALLWVTVSAALAGAPQLGARPLDPDGRMRISPSDRCPVCAMRPHRYPKFATAIQLTDHRTFYFCSSGCMITAWLHPDVYLGIDPDRLALAVVADYFSGEHVDARKRLWVSGSDVIGPMGPAVVPLGSPADVEAFRKRHGGARPFLLDTLTDDQWETIRSEGRPSP